MDKLALKILPLGKIPRNISAQAHQLDCSMTIHNACIAIENQTEPEGNLFCITGHPGSGRSTYTQALLQELFKNGSVNESEVLYLEVGLYDNVNSIWNSCTEIAKSNGDRGIVALLASNTTTHEEKLAAIVKLLSKFNIICLDYLSIDNKEVYLFFLSLVEKLLNNNIICITKLHCLPTIRKTKLCITVNGLCPEVVKTLPLGNTKFMSMKSRERSYERLLYNPTAIKLYVNSCLEFGVYEITQRSKKEMPVCCVLEIVWKDLSGKEKGILCQLSELRQLLPVNEVGSLAKVFRIGLVKYKMSEDGSFHLVAMANCVRDFVQARSHEVVPEAQDEFNVLDCWLALLSNELLGLIEDAKNNAWPFIPEKWQYVTVEGGKEGYNVKDLITSNSKLVPHLTQLDILQECLHHSVVRKDYKSMAAIIFVLDRFIYWQGGSKLLLSIVDTVMKGDPQLPIAPQLVIRKARILRTSGDLQGAEKVLDELLNEREKLGVWKYKEKHDHHLVRGVCIQIKGEIQASLGQWFNAATMLLDSVHLFKTLPKVDKKGLSCSLGLLVNTLQSMSNDEYQQIASRYSLASPHPYLQAYVFAREAAEMAVFTPLFLARHKRRAGEMMLEYSQLFTDHLHSQFLNESLKELKESLQAHKSIKSLESREQFYEFISALYKTSCVFKLQSSEKNVAEDLKSASMLLYDHYCRHETAIIHDAFSQGLIKSAFSILGLPTFSQDTVAVDKVQSIPELMQGRPNVDEKTDFKQAESNTSTVDRDAETLQTVILNSNTRTVDRSKSTVLTADEKDHGPNQCSENETDKSSDVLSNVREGESYDLTTTSVYECESSRYDPIHCKWRTQITLLHIGEQLNAGIKGAQRDPFMVQCLNQDEPLGKYVGKKYKKSLGVEQYKEDVRCQMTARYYVGLFNQELYHKGVEISHIQFLPVVMLRLLDAAGEKSSHIYNMEPYIHGDFTKLTNNWSFVNKEGEGSKLVLAFSHFTYEKSNKTLLITDHQGWTSSDHLSTTFLTDPQIHSVDKKLYGIGNLGSRGMLKFWQGMHSECNEVCLQLGLRRPHGM